MSEYVRTTLSLCYLSACYRSKSNMVLTLDAVAMYISEGANRARNGAFAATVHFWDHVGRSFSRISVYTESAR